MKGRTLRDWMDEHWSKRGGRTWLNRRAEVSFPTIAKALNGLPIQKPCAERISGATDGEVSVESLVMGDGG